MADKYIPIILGAIRELDETELEVEGGDVSTFVHGEENELFAGLYSAFAHAFACPEHTAVSLLLSRGCPGEPGEDICDPTAAKSEVGSLPPALIRSLPQVTCQFSLYPMGTSQYMDSIYEEISAAAEEKGLEVKPEHLCTRLVGSLDVVLAQLRTAFDRAAEVTPHVVIHATLGVNSPTPKSY